MPMLCGGKYVLERSNGDISLPACIVRDGDELAVRYFEKSIGHYKAREASNEILGEGIVQPLPEPTMVFRGQILLYSFKL